MTEIILTTLNARFSHASFGLRYLQANLGELKDRSELMEFVIDERPIDIAEKLLASEPRIIGIGVYIWNVVQCTELVRLLKRVAPETFIVLGGPEVSYGGVEAGLSDSADVIICGEADQVFARLCADFLGGGTDFPAIIHASPPTFDDIELPYDLYTDADLAHRVIYVEASRGCPFKCEFCLSSLDVALRKPQLERFLAAMEGLMARGLRHFKFVDRTFNLNPRASQAILEFFLERYEEGMFLHFEMVPDRLPAGLKTLISAFPAGALQFEVGIQTFNSEVAARIQRRTNFGKLAENFAFLRASTGVHIHADLIVGLPGEDLASFASGFDRLIELGPQEIQVGILKHLKGTPLGRHSDPFDMCYSPLPPFEILQNAQLSFAVVHRMRRFARLWDLFANSGNFSTTLSTLWEDGSPFQGFMAFSEFIHQTLGKTHKISLARQAEALFNFRCQTLGHDPLQAAEGVLRDFQWAGRSEIPHFLRAHLPMEAFKLGRRGKARAAIPARQARHLSVRTQTERLSAEESA